MDKRTEEMSIVGLTGGIGAGKSVVARILREKGFEVYDCDAEAKRMMETSSEIKERIRERFGNECYLPEGGLDRKYLSGKIFSCESERFWLNSLVHEAVRNDIQCRRKSLGKDKEWLFVESAILHTARLDVECKEIWVVTAPEALRFERALRRGGIEPENLRSRMEVQEKEFDSINCSRIIEIDNSGDASLLAQVDKALKNLQTYI